MNRKTGIIISLVLALILTVAITVMARKDYNTVTKTVEVARATTYIPAGAVITEANIEKVEVIESASNGMATYEEALGKTASVGIVAGQHVYKGALTDNKPPRKGYVEVLIDTTLARSAFALPGEKVNVHVLSNKLKDGEANYTSPAPLILKDITVLRVLSSDGMNANVNQDKEDVLKIGGGDIAVIGLEIPEEYAERVIQAAAADAIYLTKVSVEKENQNSQ